MKKKWAKDGRAIHKARDTIRRALPLSTHQHTYPAMDVPHPPLTWASLSGAARGVAGRPRTLGRETRPIDEQRRHTGAGAGAGRRAACMVVGVGRVCRQRGSRVRD